MLRLMKITEEELVRRCNQKDARAQKLLYDTYHSRLLGICLRYGKSKAEAEDILQMGMVRIFKYMSTFSGNGSFEGWMKRIMVNVAIDNFRKNTKHYYHEDITEVKGVPAQEDDATGNIAVKDILASVQQLPPGYRIVFNLYAIEGFSHNEIAEKLGISVNTSKTQLLKARRNLMKKLTDMNQLPTKAYAQNEG